MTYQLPEPDYESREDREAVFDKIVEVLGS